MRDTTRQKSRTRKLLREGTEEERIKVLARDVLEVALRDIRKRRYYQEAMFWFKARAQTPFGYGWCLQRSGYNPNAIKTYLQSLQH
jgi:hypothetical protein